MGKYADLVVTSSIKRIEPEIVICNGKMVVKNGKVLLEGKREKTKNRRVQDEKVFSDELIIRPHRRSKIKVRIIDQVREVVSIRR